MTTSPEHMTPRQSIDTLTARLDDGFDRIDAAQAAGLDVGAWETFWIELLQQYQAACDAIELAEAA